MKHLFWILPIFFGLCNFPFLIDQDASWMDPISFVVMFFGVGAGVWAFLNKD